ncbi:DUF6602 domain-containing protein [Brevibacillus sp. DP1.3A]|uniref:DUF6602 domain-containing protein n=1 Tax=Brevibacillus sp. DP1.3A TaxID=2738867 RepID=UPI00156B0259|nr:DUF6602 domain-containing protein [Brevibacillus sp. DP1.3A]UED72217.1 hypothetical protein HP399_015725 [Brevibacillus sp. DP1.3A]
MPNYLEYQKSVAAEFKAYEKRVRNLIDDSHWGEDGRYKEIILMNYLKRVLPKNLSVGTGFVRNKTEITSQIDIIIYDNSFPVLFSEGDFVVATPENVIGIVEVKTKVKAIELCATIEKSNKNGAIITENSDALIFNGIFSFNSNNNPDLYIRNMENHDFTPLLRRKHWNQITPPALFSCVNHIALGQRYFLKLWAAGQNPNDIESPHYSIYNMQDGLAFSYFLSNIQDFVIWKSKGYTSKSLPGDLVSFYYPLPEGKESHLVKRILLEQNQNI